MAFRVQELIAGGPTNAKTCSFPCDGSEHPPQAITPDGNRGKRARALNRVAALTIAAGRRAMAVPPGQAFHIREVRVGPDGPVCVLADSGGTAISDNTPPASRLLRLTPQ